MCKWARVSAACHANIYAVQLRLAHIRLPRLLRQELPQHWIAICLAAAASVCCAQFVPFTSQIMAVRCNRLLPMAVCNMRCVYACVPLHCSVTIVCELCSIIFYAVNFFFLLASLARCMAILGALLLIMHVACCWEAVLSWKSPKIEIGALRIRVRIYAIGVEPHWFSSYANPNLERRTRSSILPHSYVAEYLICTVYMYLKHRVHQCALHFTTGHSDLVQRRQPHGHRMTEWENKTKNHNRMMQWRSLRCCFISEAESTTFCSEGLVI